MRFKHTSSGATLVEIAIALPLFMFGILVMLWLGIALNAKASLTFALGNSLRLATTRADANLTGADLIQALHDWHADSSMSPSTVQKYLASPDRYDDFYAYYGTESLRYFRNGASNITLHDVPLEYVYALVYMNEAMRQSTGSALRYPCDPAGAGSEDGSDCLLCVFLNPDINQAYTTLDVSSVPLNPKQIALECSYQPNQFLLSPLMGMLRAMTNNPNAANALILKRRAFIEIGDRTDPL